MRGKNRKRPLRGDTDPLGSWINSSREHHADLVPKQPAAQPAGISRNICHDLALVPFVQALKPAMFEPVFQCTSGSALLISPIGLF